MTDARPVVLVTGASGFIGRHVLAALDGGAWSVHAVSRSGMGAPAPGVTWHACDLMADDATAGLIARLAPDALVHLAWEATPGIYRSSLSNLDWLAASLRLVRVFAEAGGRRAVVTGSCAEYDPVAARDGRCHEWRTPLAPTCLYGTCKAALQRALAAAAPRLGLSFAWARLFHPYGPGEPAARLVPYLVRTLAAGGRAALTDGTQERDFIAAGEVGRALVALLDSHVEGPVNIGTGTGTTVAALARSVARRLDAESRLGLGERPPAADDPPRLVADTGRLRAEVGFHPVVSLDAGLAAVLATDFRGAGTTPVTP